MGRKQTLVAHRKHSFNNRPGDSAALFASIKAIAVAVIYRLNFYRGNKLTGTELVDARKVQEANKLARRAVSSGLADQAEVQYMTGGIAFGAGPKRSP
jgi:hypothetical protein